MSYRTDKLMIDGHTDTHTHTHAGNDNTRRPKLASGNNSVKHGCLEYNSIDGANNLIIIWCFEVLKWLRLPGYTFMEICNSLLSDEYLLTKIENRHGSRSSEQNDLSALCVCSSMKLGIFSCRNYAILQNILTFIVL